MDSSRDLLERFLWKQHIDPERALVVGNKRYDDKPDRRGIYRSALGVDMLPGDGVDLVHDLEQPLPESVGQFDHIDCVSVLEHVRRPWKMAENLESCLTDGGTILVCVPFVWRVHAYPSDYWRMTAEALIVLFPSVQWRARKYLTEGRLRKLTPTREGAVGPWLARSELVAFGVKVRP